MHPFRGGRGDGIPEQNRTAGVVERSAMDRSPDICFRFHFEHQHQPRGNECNSGGSIRGKERKDQNSRVNKECRRKEVHPLSFPFLSTSSTNQVKSSQKVKSQPEKREEGSKRAHRQVFTMGFHRAPFAQLLLLYFDMQCDPDAAFLPEKEEEAR